MLDLLNTKEELNSYGVVKKPKSFYYRVLASDKRGYNKQIAVSVIAKDGTPYRLGYTHYHTASCRGENAEVRHLIKAVYGYKMKDGYHFADDSINIHEFI